MPRGLRERKKLRTRAAIQRAALHLFERHGYQATTIEEIAAAADISPSTFFNYFPTKEALFLEDDYDPLIFAAFAAQPPDVAPITAVRNAMRQVFSSLDRDALDEVRRRMRLVVREPALRAAMLGQFAELTDQLADLLATRAGRPVDDFEVRNVAGAFLGVMLAVLMTASRQPEADLLELADRAIGHLDAGLPL